ncbi:hypothetical protein OG229_02175 [Streptomyces platensis]|uniref:hypothetical protein n=1 Tax=Streptomyces platensis TaxID=58346 RepID=UPI002E15E6C5|nr:hypothetical protein OG229_02175 [Streptomyces platensis]
MSDPISLPDVDTVIKTGATFARDLVERILSTFLQAFIGGIAVTQPLNGSMWQAALVGGVAAALSLVKGLFARFSDVEHSASLAKGV